MSSRSSPLLCVALMLGLLAPQAVSGQGLCKSMLSTINKGAQAALEQALQAYDFEDLHLKLGKFRWSFINIKVEPLPTMTMTMEMNDDDTGIIWKLTDPSMAASTDWELKFKFLWWNFGPKGSAGVSFKADHMTTSISLEDTDQCSLEVGSVTAKGLPWWLRKWFNNLIAAQLKNNARMGVIEDTMCTILKSLVKVCSALGGK